MNSGLATADAGPGEFAWFVTGNFPDCGHVFHYVGFTATARSEKEAIRIALEHDPRRVAYRHLAAINVYGDMLGVLDRFQRFLAEIGIPEEEHADLFDEFCAFVDSKMM